MFNNNISEESSTKEGHSQRMPFKAEEDEKLRELVAKYGDTNWKLISSFMPNRSVRQCRERWNNNLASNILKDKWSAEEDELLKRKYYEFGPKWKLLETFFPGRTSYNIRNRWSCIVRLWNIYSSSSLLNHLNLSSQQNQKQNKQKSQKTNNNQNQNLNININQNQNQNLNQNNEKIKKELQIQIKPQEVETKNIEEIQHFENIPNKFEEFDDLMEINELFFQENYFDCF